MFPWTRTASQERSGRFDRFASIQGTRTCESFLAYTAPREQEDMDARLMVRQS